MKKYLLSVLVAGLFASSYGNEPHIKHPPVKSGTKTNVKVTFKEPTPVFLRENSASRGSRSLNITEIATSVNLFGVLNSSSRQLYTNDALNAAVFIHRSDTAPAVCCPNSNGSQYRYEVSKDGGATWSGSSEVLNPAASNSFNYSCRYPQAMIHNPAGNTIADSAYLVYTGTWHNNATNAVWRGECRGAAKLNQDQSTFTTKRDTVLTGSLGVAGSFCTGAPGKFFNLNYTDTIIGANTRLVKSIALMRGTWNPTTRTVDWVDQAIPLPTIERVISPSSGNVLGSAFGLPRIAFDPTGQYGWIVFKADLEVDDFHAYKLYYMTSTDYGATWSPITELSYKSVSGLLPVPNIEENGAPGNPTFSAFSDNYDLKVDYQGNPHIGVILHFQDSTMSSYYDSKYHPAGYWLYDIYKTSNCGWNSHLVSRVFSTGSSYTADSGNDEIYETNRLQMSKTEDGKKIFFFWNDTDSATVAGEQDFDYSNISPNLMVKGVDVAAKKVTGVKNLTVGHPFFGGQTQNDNPGLFGGSLYPVVSQTAFTRPTDYNIPVVLAEPDYNQQGSNKFAIKPAKLYIVKNVDIPAADFIGNYDNLPPSVTLIGADSVFICKGSNYTDAGANAFKCGNPGLTPVITSTVNTNQVGVYSVKWTATDSFNNSASKTRKVVVGDVPTAKISVKKNWGNNFTFTDSSYGIPSTRSWQLGDGKTDNKRVSRQTYTSAGQKMIILTVSNPCGTDADTTYINVALGIEDESFASHVRVSPNPTKGIITLEAVTNENLTVEIYNLLGNLVTVPQTFTKNAANKYTMDLNALASGLYLMKILSGNAMAVKHITIVK